MIKFLSVDRCITLLTSLLIYVIPFFTLLVASDLPYGALNLKTFAFRITISLLVIFYSIKKILEKNQRQVVNNFILKSYLIDFDASKELVGQCYVPADKKINYDPNTDGLIQVKNSAEELVAAPARNYKVQKGILISN